MNKPIIINIDLDIVREIFADSFVEKKDFYYVTSLRTEKHNESCHVFSRKGEWDHLIGDELRIITKDLRAYTKQCSLYEFLYKTSMIKATNKETSISKLFDELNKRLNKKYKVML